MSKNLQKHQVAEIIIRHLRGLIASSGEELDIGIGTDLIGSGVLDSLNIVRLIQFMEKEFSIYIDDEDICPELFSNANHLAEYVISKS